jgi:hypothetical protein
MHGKAIEIICNIEMRSRTHKGVETVGRAIISSNREKRRIAREDRGNPDSDELFEQQRITTRKSYQGVFEGRLFERP